MKQNIPNIAVVDTTDTIASCNACGVQNYFNTSAGITPSGVKLVDLRISPNGYQTQVIKLCGHCRTVLKELL